MPPPIMIRALESFLDAVISAAERFIERVGDPDMRRSIVRDREALGLAHRHLAEALDELQVLRDFRDRDAAEIMRLRGVLDEVAGLRQKLSAPAGEKQTMDLPPRSAYEGPHGRFCCCLECKGETDGNQ